MPALPLFPVQSQEPAKLEKLVPKLENCSLNRKNTPHLSTGSQNQKNIPEIGKCILKTEKLLFEHETNVSLTEKWCL